MIFFLFFALINCKFNNSILILFALFRLATAINNLSLSMQSLLFHRFLPLFCSFFELLFNIFQKILSTKVQLWFFLSFLVRGSFALLVKIQHLEQVWFLLIFCLLLRMLVWYLFVLTLGAVGCGWTRSHLLGLLLGLWFLLSILWGIRDNFIKIGLFTDVFWVFESIFWFD